MLTCGNPPQIVPKIILHTDILVCQELKWVICLLCKVTHFMTQFAAQLGLQILNWIRWLAVYLWGSGPWIEARKGNPAGLIFTSIILSRFLCGMSTHAQYHYLVDITELLSLLQCWSQHAELVTWRLPDLNDRCSLWSKKLFHICLDILLNETRCVQIKATITSPLSLT